MEKGTRDPSAAAAARPGPGGAPQVLDYARPPAAGSRLPPATDSIDVAAGCAVTAAALLSTVGAVGLFTTALSRLASAEADPFGPAFLFSGALVLAAVAVTCWRAVRREKPCGGEAVRTNP